MNRVLLACAAVAAIFATGWLAVSALYSDSQGLAANNFTTDSLNPPTALSAAVAGSDVNLSWTVTVDTYATGYRILRATASGGPYTQVAQVTPRTTTSHTDSPGTGTFYYVARSYFQSWESVSSNQASANNSQPVSTGYLNCSSDVAVTASSGDNNGFQKDSAKACADGGGGKGIADDDDSGTDTTTSCAGSGKDRHIFYNYGFSLPAGATINGIRVRLDAFADSAAGAPFVCVALSWDGGASWTSVKVTPTLTNAEITYILGSTSDLWGRAWNTGDFSNANFRLRVTNVAADATRDFRLDWVAVEVTYTP